MSSIDRKLDKLLSNQVSELGILSVIFIVILTLITNTWSQYIFDHLDLDNRKNFNRLIGLTVGFVVAIVFILIVRINKAK